MAVLRIDRLTRVKMLLTSYLDARPGLLAGADNGQGKRPRPGSTIPRMGDLWQKGSYQELEDALNELPLVSAQRLWRAFINQPDRRRRSVQLIFRQKHGKLIQRDLERVSRAMPRRIYVPKDVILNWQDGLNTQFARPSKSSDSPVRSEEA